MKGVWFNEKHSFSDWNLILSAADIPPAVPKTSYVDIPGGDGSIDLTEALGEVRYSNRECVFTFTVFPYEDFEAKKTLISNLLNGKRFKIRLDKDPDYYWEGRCDVNGYSQNKRLRKITVRAIVAPYKMRRDETELVFEAGEDITKNVIITGRKTVIPTFTAGEGFTMTLNGNVYAMPYGEITDPSIQLFQGENVIKITSDWPVTMRYREGEL